jgi:hypothetical protein
MDGGEAQAFDGEEIDDFVGDRLLGGGHAGRARQSWRRLPDEQPVDRLLEYGSAQIGLEGSPHTGLWTNVRANHVMVLLLMFVTERKIRFSRAAVEAV